MDVVLHKQKDEASFSKDAEAVEPGHLPAGETDRSVMQQKEWSTANGTASVERAVQQEAASIGQ